MAYRTLIRVYVIPLFGAYLADTRWGRFKTVCVSVGIALFGHILLIISAVPSVIEHTHGATACFILAVIIMGVGTGGFKSNISPLVAEQYRRSKLFIKTEKSGERVIVDPGYTTSRIYMVSSSIPRSRDVNTDFDYRSTSTSSPTSVL